MIRSISKSWPIKSRQDDRFFDLSAFGYLRPLTLLIGQGMLRACLNLEDGSVMGRKDGKDQIRWIHLSLKLDVEAQKSMF